MGRLKNQAAWNFLVRQCGLLALFPSFRPLPLFHPHPAFIKPPNCPLLKHWLSSQEIQQFASFPNQRPLETAKCKQAWTFWAGMISWGMFLQDMRLAVPGKGAI
eukprot:1157957-Pelagomonas_calceolata.AAC.3